MLAERFETAHGKLLARAAARASAGAARDDFVAAQFPLLDAAFASLVDAATGSHPRLGVVKTQVTDTVTGRSFASLDKTVIEVRSTLYDRLEQVVFTPDLESLDREQLGVIRVETQGFTAKPFTGPDAAPHAAMLERGIWMRGAAAAHLVIPVGRDFEPLTAARIEGFLAALLVRTG